MASSDRACRFCKIVQGSVPAAVVFKDDVSLAFLDHHPLFLGHTLLVPLDHHETLPDLPPGLVGPFFANAQLLAQAVQASIGCDGTFIAMNNRVSQSVPHLHLHVIPRRFGDGLKGFFWPRQRYGSQDAMEATARAIGGALELLRAENPA